MLKKHVLLIQRQKHNHTRLFTQNGYTLYQSAPVKFDLWIHFSIHVIQVLHLNIASILALP